MDRPLAPILALIHNHKIVDAKNLSGVKKYVVHIFHSRMSTSLGAASNSAYTLTMLCYAPMNWFGPSNQKQEWPITKKFASFLFCLVEKSQEKPFTGRELSINTNCTYKMVDPSNLGTPGFHDYF